MEYTKFRILENDCIDGYDIEGFNSISSEYVRLAYINNNSMLIYEGDLPSDLCKRIEEFLNTEGIYIHNCYAYVLNN